MVKNIGDKEFLDLLWDSAVKLRGALEPAEYKHPVLGLLFLKYVSDSFNELHQKLHAWTQDPNNQDYYEDTEEKRLARIEDRDEYEAENVFWIPEESRWNTLAIKAKQTDIAIKLDEAMRGIERENPKIKGLLYTGFALLKIPAAKIGELIDLIGQIGFNSKDHKSADILGYAYEFFLGKFALEEGKGAGQFYTSETIVRTIVEVIAPTKGQLYEPAIGSAGMVVWSEKYMEEHGGERGDISVFGQEYTHTTWKMAAMNLIIRGIDFNLGETNGDTLLNDLHKDVRADYIMANPPFNQSDWGAASVRGDVRWKYGEPSNSNANYAWIQHMVHHLNSKGRAGVVMANGAMTSNSNNEDVIRKGLVEDDLVECMVALPPKMFINTQIPACIFFFNRNKSRKGETLFIDARHMGRLETRAWRVFDDEDIQQIAKTYHSWAKKDVSYKDVQGFCKSATIEDIRTAGFNLSPGVYVGAAEIEEDEVDFEEDMATLTSLLSAQIQNSLMLDKEVKLCLSEVGYEMD